MLEYKGYHASIEFDSDDCIFVGEVFGINDSLSFHGTTVDEMKQMFEQSIDNYIQLCEKIGKNPDKEFKGNFNVRIPPELHKKAALEAAKQKISLNQYVHNCIEKSFDENNLTIKETRIFIPYPVRTVDWEKDNRNSSAYLYNNSWIYSEGGRSYVGSLS